MAVIQFNLPEGAIVHTYVYRADARTEKAARRGVLAACVALDPIGYFRILRIEGKDTTPDPAPITIRFFNSYILAPVTDHNGHESKKLFSLSVASRKPFAGCSVQGRRVQSLWWASNEGCDLERIPTILEVELFAQGYVPHAGWMLVDGVTYDQFLPAPPERVWCAPVPEAVDPKVARDERKADISNATEMLRRARESKAEASKNVTHWRRKLNALTRIR